MKFFKNAEKLPTINGYYYCVVKTTNEQLVKTIVEWVLLSPNESYWNTYDIEHYGDNFKFNFDNAEVIEWLDESYNEVGELLPNEHPDEINPRSESWLQERRNFVREIQILRDIINEKSPPFEYIDTQTPIERLKNKLSPFINLVEVLGSEKYTFKLSFINTQDSDAINELVLNQLKLCLQYKREVKEHLSECENFYNLRENFTDGLKTSKVVFFETKDSGHFVSKNNVIITDEIFLKYKHYFTPFYNFLIIP